MAVSDQELMAYIDGELDAPTRARVEAEVAQNQILRERVERERRLRERLRAAYDPIVREPIPDQLRALAQNTVSNVVELPQSTRRVARSTSGASAWALAACAVFGILVGAVAVLTTREQNQFALSEQGLTASGALARALTTERAGTPQSRVQIALSFRAKSGEYCRAFALEGRALAGVACHAEDAQDTWRIRLLAKAGSATTSSYRTASSSLPSAVAEAIEREIEGEALDAAAEAQAMGRGWRGGK